MSFSLKYWHNPNILQSVVVFSTKSQIIGLNSMGSIQTVKFYELVSNRFENANKQT